MAETRDGMGYHGGKKRESILGFQTARLFLVVGLVTSN